MANQIIKVRRGTKAQLENYGALSVGELGFCTDTKEVYIGNGVQNFFVGRVMMGDYGSRPKPGYQGRFYYVTSGDNVGFLYIDDGTSWQKVNRTALDEITGTLDDIENGEEYGKVRNSELNKGYVKQINDNNGHITTAEEVRKHLDDEELHRKIDDNTEGTTVLWSANKIKAEIFNAVKGHEWQESVIKKGLLKPPENPVEKDRYIVGVGATGEWANHDNEIAEFINGEWRFFAPEIGWSVFVDEEGKNYVYNTAYTWVKSGEANQTIIAGNGLVGGGSSDEITISVGQGMGIIVNADNIQVKPHHGIRVNNNGVSVNIDENSIVFDEENDYKLTVKNIDGGMF